MADSTNQTKAGLVAELKGLGPVLESLADAGPALTRALGLFATYPFPTDNIGTWQRGDFANLTAVIDLTLSRLDASFLTGTRWEGDLTELELQWGRTARPAPQPYTGATAAGPLPLGSRDDDVPPLTLRIRIQLAVFAVVALIFAAAMAFGGYIRFPPCSASGATR